MSYKIYNGFMFKGDLNAIPAFVRRIQDDIYQRNATAYRFLVIKNAVDIYDRSCVENGDFGRADVKAKKVHSMAMARNDIGERLKAIASKGTSDSEVDFDVEFYLHEFEGKIYGRMSCEQMEANKFFFAQDEIIDYAYWDNTDKPGEIDFKEWRQRRRAWEGVSAQYKYGLGSFITIGIMKGDNLFYDSSVLGRSHITEDNLPDLDKRIHNQTVSAGVNMMYGGQENVPMSKITQAYYDFSNRTAKSYNHIRSLVVPYIKPYLTDEDLWGFKEISGI